MEDYCRTTGCLRNYILRYFGEQPKEGCSHCGNCDAARSRVRVTDEASLVFRTVEATGEMFGASVIANILRGSRSEAILARKLDRCATYGKLSHRKAKDIKSALDSYAADGWLLREGGEYPVLKLTDRAKAVIAGKEEVYGLPIGAANLLEQAAVDRMRGAGETVRGGLFEKLRELRRQIAAEEHVPPFVIFSDATLEDMAAKKPRSLAAMGEVRGVGAFKLRKYGARFLEAVSGVRETAAPLPEKPQETRPVIPARGAKKLVGADVKEESLRLEETLRRLKDKQQALLRDSHARRCHLFSEKVLRAIAVRRPPRRRNAGRARRGPGEMGARGTVPAAPAPAGSGGAGYGGRRRRFLSPLHGQRALPDRPEGRADAGGDLFPADAGKTLRGTERPLRDGAGKTHPLRPCAAAGRGNVQKTALM